MTRKAQPDPVAIYQPITSFVFGPDEVVIVQTETYRGSDPAVQANPGLFVPINTPRREWPDPWAEVEVNVEPDPMIRPKLTVDSPGALRVKRSWQGFMADTSGAKALAQLFEGELVQEASPVVKMIRKDKELYAQLFEPAKK